MVSATTLKISRGLILAFAFAATSAEGAFAGQCESLFQATPFPAAASFAPIDVIVQKMSPSKVKVTEVRPSHQLRESMEDIRASMLGLRHGLKNHDRAVLYPMSGFDLATPLILFPKAETYILIDIQSTMRPKDVSDFVKKPVLLDYVDRNANWIRFDKTGDDVFQKLMTSLFAHQPRAKIQSIDFFTDVNENVSARIVFRSKNKLKTIWYLVGEVGHVDGVARQDVESRRTYDPDREKRSTQIQEPWWGELIDHLGPRTLILKGSMSALRLTRFDHALPWRDRLVAGLLRNGGLIVEGSSQMDRLQDADWAKNLKPNRNRWEFTDGDIRFQRPEAFIELYNVEFSYGRNVRIGFYGPQQK